MKLNKLLNILLFILNIKLWKANFQHALFKKVTIENTMLSKDR